MEKRKWTDVSKYSELIEQLRREGKTRQEIADALGLEKVQIKNWINRHNRAQRKPGKEFFQRRRVGQGSIRLQKQKHMKKRLAACKWKTNFCGIFCDPQKGCEAQGEVWSNLSSQNGVSDSGHVQIFRSIPQRIL